MIHPIISINCYTIRQGEMTVKCDESKFILACNLLEYRLDKHLSQEEMAFRIDLSVTSYAEIERAQVHTNLEILDYISRATGLSPAQLLTPLCQNAPAVSSK